jgi:transposase
MSAIGVEHFKILEGNGNTANFLTFLNKLLLHLASTSRQNCTLVMDKVHFHKVTEVTQAIQNAGHEVVFLPAYSPFSIPLRTRWRTNVRNRAPNTDIELMIASVIFVALLLKIAMVMLSMFTKIV